MFRIWTVGVFVCIAVERSSDASMYWYGPFTTGQAQRDLMLAMLADAPIDDANKQRIRANVCAWRRDDEAPADAN